MSLLLADCVAKRFCASECARLIQDQGSRRKVDSRIHSPRFDCCAFLFYSFSAVTFATESVRLGHCGDVRCTTALSPKGEVDSRSYHVAKSPLPDIQAAALQFSVLTALGAWRRLRGPLDLDHAHIISIMRILVEIRS